MTTHVDHVDGDFRLALFAGLPPLFLGELFSRFSFFFGLVFALENGGMMSEPSSVEDVAVVCAGGSASASTALPAESGVSDPDRGESATAVGLSGGGTALPHPRRVVHVTMKTAQADDREKSACIVDLYDPATTQEAG